MSLNDTLANTLITILHDEKAGRAESTIKPISKIIKKVLDVMKDNGYISGYEEVESAGGNHLKVKLSGNVNKCGVVKPRFSVKQDGYETFEKRYLLARNMGILIISTPFGIMTHTDAQKKKTGGKLLAYCY